MKRIFLSDSPYKTIARFIAMLWTLLIFIGCFTPSHNLPKVNVPLIDKWTHFVLFGVFSFLWLCAYPVFTQKKVAVSLFVGVLLGACIELLQGAIVSLGRSMELMDAVADGIGSLLGIVLFGIGVFVAQKQ